MTRVSIVRWNLKEVGQINFSKINTGIKINPSGALGTSANGFIFLVLKRFLFCFQLIEVFRKYLKGCFYRFRCGHIYTADLQQVDRILGTSSA